MFRQPLWGCEGLGAGRRRGTRRVPCREAPSPGSSPTPSMPPVGRVCATRSLICAENPRELLGPPCSVGRMKQLGGRPKSAWRDSCRIWVLPLLGYPTPPQLAEPRHFASKGMAVFSLANARKHATAQTPDSTETSGNMEADLWVADGRGVPNILGHSTPARPSLEVPFPERAQNHALAFCSHLPALAGLSVIMQNHRSRFEQSGENQAGSASTRGSSGPGPDTVRGSAAQLFRVMLLPLLGGLALAPHLLSDTSCSSKLGQWVHRTKSSLLRQLCSLPDQVTSFSLEAA